jgi:hypothetical protein
MVPKQVAEEWATARAEAARAKAAADKPRQKAAGQVIAGLKREIAQLGKLAHPLKILAKRSNRVGAQEYLSLFPPGSMYTFNNSMHGMSLLDVMPALSSVLRAWQ